MATCERKNLGAASNTTVPVLQLTKVFSLERFLLYNDSLWGVDLCTYQ